MGARLYTVLLFSIFRLRNRLGEKRPGYYLIICFFDIFDKNLNTYIHEIRSFQY